VLRFRMEHPLRAAIIELCGADYAKEFQDADLELLWRERYQTVGLLRVASREVGLHFVTVQWWIVWEGGLCGRVDCVGGWIVQPGDRECLQVLALKGVPGLLIDLLKPAAPSAGV
jgi:hypothetical protein